VNILVIGGTGGTGQAIVREALALDHEVVALVRKQAKAGALLPGARLEQGDARDTAALSRALAGCDAVIRYYVAPATTAERHTPSPLHTSIAARGPQRWEGGEVWR
jgi:putative NADH-flavin reductase